MMHFKIYKCNKCNKKLDYKPIRLTKQEYGIHHYNQYYPVKHYDFCKECYKKIERELENTINTLTIHKN